MTLPTEGPVLATENLLTDNPALYELHFPDTGRDAQFVDNLVSEFGTRGDGIRLLDIGSGTGRDAARLAALGYDVRAVDISPTMVAHARAKYANVSFEVGDARLVTTREQVDVVICLGSTLLHLHSNADIVAALTRFAECLRPGGLLVLEMRNAAFLLTDRGRRDLLDGESVRTVEWLGVAYTSRTTLSLDLPEQLLRRRREWSWQGADPVAQHTAWRLLFPQELRYLLSSSGLDVVAMFDGPGSLADPAWPGNGNRSTGLTGLRLYVVARRIEQSLTS